MRLGALALTACGLLAGCGGSSGSSVGGPGEKFIGRWELDNFSNSTFTIDCPATFPNQPAPLWNELPLEQGTLADVTETSSFCLPNDLSFNLDKDGVTLSIANPDPFTGMAPICAFQVSATQFVEIDFTAFTFTLLKASAGQPPKALLAGTATGSVLQDDGTGNLTIVDSCTYTGIGDTYHQMTKL